MARTNLNFNDGRSKADLNARNVAKSLWVNVLGELAEGVQNGPGEYDTFYLIGTFDNASGARTTVRNLSTKQADNLPGVFDLNAVVVPVVDDNGKPVMVEITRDGETSEVQKRTSELWAALVSPERAGEVDHGVLVSDEDDEDDEDASDDEAGETEDDDAEANEQRAKASRTRKATAAA